MKDILELFEFATNLELGDLGIIQDTTEDNDLASKLECFCKIARNTDYPWGIIKNPENLRNITWLKHEKERILFYFTDQSANSFLSEYKDLLNNSIIVLISKNEVEIESTHSKQASSEVPFLEFDLSAEYLKHIESWQYIDLWDLVSAHHTFYTEWSAGFDDNYTRQCEISKYFKPSRMFAGITDPSFNMALDVYIDLVRLNEGDTLKNHEIIVKNLEDAEEMTEDLQDTLDTLEEYKQQKLGFGEWVE